MRIVLTIGGVILTCLGVIWFLQGINVLPGSFMTGDIHWAFYGGAMVTAGVVLLIRANRRSRKS